MSYATRHLSRVDLEQPLGELEAAALGRVLERRRDRGAQQRPEKRHGLERVLAHLRRECRERRGGVERRLVNSRGANVRA